MGRVAVFRWLILIAGTSLFVVLIRATGVDTLARDLADLGPAFLPYVLLTGVENAFHTLGTRWCFSRRHRSAVSFWHLFLICQTGQAFNTITPSAEIGGEVARGLVLEQYVPGSEAASVVIINKFTFSIARMLAAAVLTAWTVLVFPLARLEVWILGIGATLITMGLLGFAVFQARGMFGAVLTRLARLAGASAEAWARAHVGPLDERLRSYYRRQGRDAVIAILWDLAGFAVGIVQRSYMISVLTWGTVDGAEVSLLRGTAVWAIMTLADMVFFVVTGGIGVLEMAHKLAFEAVGLPGSQGIAFSLVVRLNQLVWVLVGLAAYWVEVAAGPKRRAAARREGSGGQ
jgi:uncharacterized protein (TIRG00374 family)